MNEASEDEEIGPKHFYFNGQAMPKWSADWHSCGVLERARDSMESWDERINWQDLWILYCRIDHEGVTESEDPVRFQICALEFLRLLLADKANALASLSEFAQSQEATPEAVFTNLKDGLSIMIGLVRRESLAFWVTGGENDRLKLIDQMRRHRLPRNDPNYFRAPHEEKDRSEADHRIELIEAAIRSISSTISPETSEPDSVRT